VVSTTDLLCDQAAGSEDLRYGHTAAAAGADATPRPVVVWAITQACNLRCVHCYASASAAPAPNELSHDEGRALLDDLQTFKVPAVLFSGGEPLVRPDCVDLIAYARQIGLRCTLSTNGLLIDDAMADRLAEVALQYIGISLDGTQERHDRLRGQLGAFDTSLAGINRCVKRGIKVGVRFTIHAMNHQDLEPIFDICLAHGVQRLCIYHLAYAGRAGHMQKVDLSGPQTRLVMERIFSRTRQLHAAGHKLEVLTVANHADAAYLLLHLQAIDWPRAALAQQRLLGTGGNRSGCNIASIDSVGCVHYDQFSWHYTCGNIRQSSFSQIWTTAADERLAILRNRAGHLPPRCQSCRFLPICNGNLRTRAEAATGNWLGEDPGCYLTNDEITAAVV